MVERGGRDQAAGQGAAPVVEFHPHRFKLRLLGGLAGLGAGTLLALWLDPAAEAPRTASASATVLITAAALIAAAVGLWLRAADARPLLRVGPEGLEDHLIGPVPWSAVAGYRLSRSVLSPGFGYNLKPGAQLSRNKATFRIQAVLNLIAGLPARSFRRKMVVGGVAPMLEAFRAHRPDLDRS